MAKKKEQSLAEKYFIEFFKTQKEISEILEVTEKTVSEWVRKGNWKALRDARINNSGTRAENIKKVIADLTESTLEIRTQIREAEAKGDKALALDLKKESTRLAQEVGMYQKALEKMEKDYKISLSTYLEIMESIFQNMNEFDQELYLKTLVFQKYHLQKIANTHS
ncbi:hypothetical protein ABE545_10700 [Sphingobacterium faecium]|jgi:predicted transcriptional regulator|uniref:hypothetical protein n=1 Tax=Sphingobacterium faecium TaxID=34087 RepID=UPI00320896E2